MNEPTIQNLIEHFGIDDVLVFSENEHGAIKASLTTSTCMAEIYMQGAHLTQWQPTGQKQVLFLSEHSAFEPGKAIRGGVPLIFPWFGAHKNAADSAIKFPSHGFARTSNDWLLVGAGRSKDDFMMTFELTDSDQSRSFGYDNFKITYKIAVGEELELELIVENHSNETMQIEEAFHTYFAVSNVEQISLTGLIDTDYLDKTDNFKRKKQTDRVLQLAGETDRPYLNSGCEVDIEDPAWKRKISIDKLNSQSTVIWNPWREQTAKLSDMNPDAWQQMVCVETANLDENAINIPPGKHHAMHARVQVN
ncbi:D-hexose-6-phosphate mutarotase [soil metagenome]